MATDSGSMRKTIEAFNAMAYSFGPTPRYDTRGRVVPVGIRHPGSRVYVVWCGRATGLFWGWDLTHAMTYRYPGQTQVGCDSVEEARVTFLRRDPKFDGIWRFPKPAMARPTPGYGHGPVGEPVISGNDVDQANREVEHVSDLVASTIAHIDIPIPRGLTAAALQQLNISERSSAVEVPPSLDAVSGLTDDTVSWHTVQTPQARSAGSSHGTSSSSTTQFTYNPEEAMNTWVVIRGKNPGVYRSRHEADDAADFMLGMKIITFIRKTDAYVYFVQKYMKGMVGQPQVVIV